MQYTLRNVPAAIDALLRRRAREEGKSLNEVALEALVRGLGAAGTPIKQRDLSDIAASWRGDRKTDEVLAEQRRIDPNLWPDLWPDLGR